MSNDVRSVLEQYADHFNRPSFIEDDPISVPHRFSLLQDIEISGFFAAIMAWGQRPTIIRNANALMQLMDDAPHQFITQHKETDRKRFVDFRHRTFQPDDVLYLIHVLQQYYQQHTSLEDAFANHMTKGDTDVYAALAGYHELIFNQEHVLERTRKHIATPIRKSSCKRLNMFLRWMVRDDDRGVDFGLWKKISPAQLIIPLDLHVGRVARKFGLLDRHINDWQSALQLTEKLREFDKDDPVKYDFALFGVGVKGF